MSLPAISRAPARAESRPKSAAASRAARITMLLLLGTALGSPAASAGTVTWTGLGASDLWSDAANWNPAGPATGDDVVLAQTGTHAPTTFDITFNAKSLTFGNTTNATTLANGYIVNPGGGSFGLQSGGSIIDNSNTSVIDQLNIDVALGGPATISGSHALLFGGVISGSGGVTIDNTAGIIFAGDNT